MSSLLLNRRQQIKGIHKAEMVLRRIAEQKNRRVSLILLVLVPLFILYVGARVFHNRQALAKLHAQTLTLEQEIQTIELQNAEQLAVLENDDPAAFEEYIIRSAREKLGLALPGDQIFWDRSRNQTAP